MLKKDSINRLSLFFLAIFVRIRNFQSVNGKDLGRVVFTVKFYLYFVEVSIVK